MANGATPDGLHSNQFVLDVLTDLEAERRRRIELEATVKHLSNQQPPRQIAVEHRQVLEALSTNNSEGTVAHPGHSACNNVEAFVPIDQLSPEAMQSGYEMSSLKAERDGLKQIIDALIDNNQQPGAVAAASASLAQKIPTLPLHIIQMLETTPWDPRARRHTSYVEEVYEWQYYSKRHGWTRDIKDFPSCSLKGLPRRTPKATPIEVPSNQHCGPDRRENKNAGAQFQNGKHRKNKSVEFTTTQPTSLSPDSSKATPSRLALNFTSGCVLTNHDCNVRYNLEHGFPMPQEGTWSWVGGWRVDSSENPMECDSHGWAYSDEVEHLVLRHQAHCRASPRPEKGDEQRDWEKLMTFQPKHHLSHGIVRPYRLRRWSRMRVLSSYPYIGEKANHFLSLLAENAGLTVSISKVSNQLLDTQVRLAEREERIACSRELAAQVQSLQKSVFEKDDRVKTLELAALEMDDRSKDLEKRLAASEKRFKDSERRASSGLPPSCDKNLGESTPRNFVPRRLFKSASEKITSVRAESPPSPLTILQQGVTNASASFALRLRVIAVDEREGGRPECGYSDSESTESSVTADAKGSPETMATQQSCSFDSDLSLGEPMRKGIFELEEERDGVSVCSTVTASSSIVETVTEKRLSVLCQAQELLRTQGPSKKNGFLPFMPYKFASGEGEAPVLVSPDR